MGFWHRHPDRALKGWKVTRIAGPDGGQTPQLSVIYLTAEQEAALTLDPTGMFYIELDPNQVPPLTFATNLPGNNGSDATATYLALGANKTFTVEMEGGIPPYHYAWFRRASSTDNPIGSDQNTYNIPSYAASNNGDYFCRVTDSAGQTVESLRERTKVAIRLTTNLAATATWTAGTSASLAVVAADGLLPYTYQWQQSTDGATWTNVTNGGASGITGATGPTLTFATPQESDSGKRFRCTVTSANNNAPKTVTSNVCTVTVNPAA
ncbi:Hoc-like head decoration [Escherichia phage C130_2]|uniref:Neck whiskers protein n=1 Tax=Escherichia phage C130_2 TaxID=2234093 RepID=A0A384ZRU9_9CAUD|nr:Hoc-like head decoration [Escherichia phage C130_2]AXC34366.1 neck whiskers protein [Escherichia phage C130_2]